MFSDEMVVSAVQPLNALFPTIVLGANSISSRATHPENALEPMLFSAAMLTVSRDSHPEKAFPPTCVTLSAVIDSRAVNPLKVLPPICVTLGSVTDSRYGLSEGRNGLVIEDIVRCRIAGVVSIHGYAFKGRAHQGPGTDGAHILTYDE